MSLGPEMETLYDGPAMVKSSRFDLPAGVTWEGGIAGFMLSGPVNEAKVLRSDVMACKAYVTEIDTVLLPFQPRKIMRSRISSGAAVGADQCVVNANSIIQGKIISRSKAKNVGACCDACETNDNCNAWVYCAMEAGCRLPDGESLMPFGTCQLRRSANIVRGNMPNFEHFNSSTTFTVSGWIPGAKQLEQIVDIANLGNTASRNASSENRPSTSSQKEPSKRETSSDDVVLKTASSSNVSKNTEQEENAESESPIGPLVNLFTIAG